MTSVVVNSGNTKIIDFDSFSPCRCIFNSPNTHTHTHFFIFLKKTCVYMITHPHKCFQKNLNFRSCLTFRSPPARVAAAVLLVLAALSFNLSVGAELPKLDYLTLMDWYGRLVFVYLYGCMCCLCLLCSDKTRMLALGGNNASSLQASFLFFSSSQSTLPTLNL